jgi:type II restriction enzyme
LGGPTFRNEDIYAFENELAALHPGNRHIRDKIRQQLQVLRDTGFLSQPERGVWQVK